MESPSNNKLVYLQIGRGFAAVYVVLFHAQGLLKLNFDIDYKFQLFSAGHSGVEFFFVLSGFIIAFVHWPDIGKPARAQVYFFSRFTRIYPIYWVALALSVAGAWRLGTSDVADASMLKWMQNILLLPQDSLWLLPVAWTLSFEMFFYLMLGLCVLTGRLGLIVMGCWLALSAIQTGYGLAGGKGAEFPVSFFLSHYNLLFGAGIAVALLYRNGSRLIRPAWLPLGLALFLAAAMFDPGEKAASFTLIYGAASALIIAGMVAYESRVASRPPSALMRIGDASYSIYLFHLPIMIVAAAVIRMLGLPGPLPPMVILMVLAVIGCVAGLVAYQVFEGPILKTARKLRAARFAAVAR